MLASGSGTCDLRQQVAYVHKSKGRWRAFFTGYGFHGIVSRNGFASSASFCYRVDYGLARRYGHTHFSGMLLLCIMV